MLDTKVPGFMLLDSVDHAGVSMIMISAFLLCVCICCLDCAYISLFLRCPGT